MHEVCGINIEEVETLQSFLDPDKRNELSYVDMLRMFKEPAYMNELARRKIPHLLDEDKFEPNIGNRAKTDAPVNLTGAFESKIKSSSNVAMSSTSAGAGLSKYSSNVR